MQKEEGYREEERKKFAAIEDFLRKH